MTSQELKHFCQLIKYEIAHMYKPFRKPFAVKSEVRYEYVRLNRDLLHLILRVYSYTIIRNGAAGSVEIEFCEWLYCLLHTHTHTHTHRSLLTVKNCIFDRQIMTAKYCVVKML